MTKLVSTNPSQNFQLIGEIEITSEQEVIAKVNKAKKAFKIWNNIPVQERISYF